MARKITKTKATKTKKRPATRAKTKAAVKTATKPVAKPVAAPKTKRIRARERTATYSVTALKEHLTDLFSATAPHRARWAVVRKAMKKARLEPIKTAAGWNVASWTEAIARGEAALQRKGISLE